MTLAENQLVANLILDIFYRFCPGEFTHPATYLSIYLVSMKLAIVNKFENALVGDEIR